MITAIFTIALIGLSISYKIYYNKKNEIHVCPIGSSCKAVLQSKHNKLLGIPNEINGMLYYGFIAISYMVILFGYETAPSIKAFLLTVTAIAFLFSIYLTLIQGLQLKQWCTWCIGSAIVSTIIFILTFINTIPYLNDITTFLSTQSEIIIAVYSLGFALGLGSITCLYFLLYNFFCDFKISKNEKDVVHRITQIIWIGLIMITVSELCLILITKQLTLSSIIILIIIITKTFLTLFVIPHLSKLSVKRKTVHGKLCSWRKIVFGVGAVSITSWYSLFLLNYINIPILSFSQVIFIFIGLLAFSVIASQIFDDYIVKKYISEQKKK